MPFNFKNIKSLFVVEEEGAVKPESVPGRNIPSKETAPDKAAENLVRETQGGDPGKVSARFMEVLFAAMENQNLPGLDYLEYKQSLKSLEKMPMDEQVRYQSAFAMAQAMGATPQKLIESANHYLDVLKGEQSKFNQALKNQQTDQIGNREENLKKLETTLQQKAEQIRKLTQEMEQHRQEMEQMKKEINEAAAKVTTTRDNFIASFNALTAQIMADVENIKKYLK